MARLCSRPGCSAVAVAACGMDPSQLVCWLASVEPVPDDALGVLCDTHAERLVAPVGWTLDDRRHGRGVVSEMRLFDTAPDPTAPRPARVVLGRPGETEPESDGQLVLSEPVDPGEPVDVDETLGLAHHDDLIGFDEALEVEHAVDSTPSWPPLGGYDPDDDVLPDVSGPLIARAFRGIDDSPAH